MEPFNLMPLENEHDQLDQDVSAQPSDAQASSTVQEQEAEPDLESFLEASLSPPEEEGEASDPADPTDPAGPADPSAQTGKKDADADADPAGEDETDETDETEQSEEDEEKALKDLKATRDQERYIRNTRRQRAKFKAERDELRTQLDEIARAAGLQSAQELTPQRLQQTVAEAQGFQQLQGYMNQNNLAPEDVQVGLTAMAAISAGDWDTFEKIAGPYFEMMRTAKGVALPDDLERQVNDGLIDRDLAASIAKDRMEKRSLEIQAERASRTQERLTQQQAHQQQAYQQQQQQAAQERILSEVNRWADTEAKQDLDFQMKFPFIRDALAARSGREGPPKTPEQAVQWAKEAHKTITSQLRAQRQQNSRPRPAAPPPSGNAVRPNADTIEEVLEQSLSG